MEHTPPPRYGDWSAVNRHLTNGGSLEHVPWGNDYLPYIKEIMKKKEHPLVEEIEEVANKVTAEMFALGIAEKEELEQVYTVMLNALQDVYDKGAQEEREKIEDVFKKVVPPHGMDVYDAVWLRRLLNKAFHHVED